MGTGRRQRAGRRSAKGRCRDPPCRADWRGTLLARAPPRPAAGASAWRACRIGCEVDLPQSDPSDARRFVRRTGHRPVRNRGAPRPGGRQDGEGVVKAIGAIAVNVFRESVRDKVLYNLVLFAILMI